MSVYIVVHKKEYKDARKVSDYLYKTLKELYPSKLYRYHDDQVITLGNGIQIDLRFGTNPYRLAGLWPNYYYVEDDGDIADMLEMGACKCNGKRLKNLDQVIHIVKLYMAMFDEIDKWLDKEDENKGLYEGDDALVKEPWELEEIDGYSGAICKCGRVLHIKTPKIKTWHQIKCPKCGFMINLYCGQIGDKLSMSDVRNITPSVGVLGD